MIGRRSRCNKEYSRNHTRGLLKHPPHTDEMADGTDTDHYMQPDADNSVEQINPTPTNPRSSKYDLRHNPKPNCNNDYR